MPENVCTEVRELYTAHVDGYWAKAWERMTKRLEGLAGDRFERDTGEFNKDRRQIQIRDMTTNDNIRHIVAKLTERPRSAEARAVDKIDDPMMGEAAVAIVDWDLGQPWKAFDDRLEGWIQDACRMAMGIVWTDLVPPGRYGPFAQRIDRRIDPRNALWDECYEDPHEPGCTFFLEKRRMPVKEIHATWPKSKWVKPDKEGLTASKSAKTGYPVMSIGGRHPLHTTDVDDDKATVWLCWYKNDFSVNETSGEQELELPEQRYLCSSGCGYKTPPFSQAETLPVNPPQFILPRTPGETQGGCLLCGGGMELQTHRTVSQSERMYEGGKRLVIIAPFQHERDEQPIYDGKWPVPKMRSFPGLFLTEYQEPGEPVGHCEVDNTWDSQAAYDQLQTHMLHQVFSHQLYWEFPSVGFTNWQGERWLGRDDDYNFIFRDATNPFQGEIHTHSGTGLDPNIGLALQVLRNTLTAGRPSGDIELTQDQSKNLAVGTAEILQQQGETPVEHLNRRKNRALSRFYGVRWDMIRHTMTPQELMRLRLEGTDIMVDGLLGDDLANYDFWIEDTPRFAGIEKDRVQGYQAMMQAGQQAMAMGQDPALAIEVFADVASLPKSTMRKVQKLFATAQPMLGMGGLPPAGPGGDTGPPPQDSAGMSLAA